MKALLLLLLIPSSAFADDDEAPVERPFRGSASIGGSLLASGENSGSHFRADAEVDLEPRSRFGGLLALRAFDTSHHGLACAGLIYEAAAARPELVLSLHADLGADLDVHAPMIGGGVRLVGFVLGPMALVFDGGTYFVYDGVSRSRLVLSSAAMLAVAW